MPRFRPSSTVNGAGSSFGGFMEGQIVDFNERSDEFDWADIFIDVTFRVPISQYPVIYSLKGTYDREDDGNIKSCSLLNRIYYLFDAIGFKGGPNVKGDWEDDNGEIIPKIDVHLSENHIHKDALTSDNNPYHIFVYKEWVADKGKAYTRVCPKIVMNTTKGITDLKSYIAFLRQKNILKEYTGETTQEGNPPSSTNLSVPF